MFLAFFVLWMVSFAFQTLTWQNHLEGLLKCSFLEPNLRYSWSSMSEIEPMTVPVWQASRWCLCCFSMSHTLRDYWDIIVKLSKKKTVKIQKRARTVPSLNASCFVYLFIGLFTFQLKVYLENKKQTKINPEVFYLYSLWK